MNVVTWEEMPSFIVFFYSESYKLVTSYLLNSNHLLHFWHRWLHVDIFFFIRTMQTEKILKTHSVAHLRKLSMHVGYRDSESKYLAGICPPIYCKAYFKVSSLF